MYQHLTECKTHAENLQISFCFLLIFLLCICLKILENIWIPVNMIDRLDITSEGEIGDLTVSVPDHCLSFYFDITDGFSVKCVFILNTLIFIDAVLNISLRKF